jgi:hypothetical protein
MVPCFMLSLLKRQQLMLQDRFIERYPSCWLVWEPSNWKPPSSTAEADGGKTQLPTHMGDQRPKGTDALCFQLHPPRGAPTADLTVGRANDSDIVVNDMTVSRVHLKLHLEQGRWTAEAVSGPDTATEVDHVKLTPGAKSPLPSGSAVVVGGVTLTFYDAESFAKRVRA